MRVEKKNKAFAYRVPIGDYNYLQCREKIAKMGPFALFLNLIMNMVKKYYRSYLTYCVS